MALVLKGKVTIKEDGTEVYIEFLNATGTYDVTDNPGGFGAPNPARNSLAVIIYAAHKLTTGDVDATVQNFNPLSVASFTISIDKTKNGVLFWNIFALPIYNSGNTYQDGDIVWDNTNPSEAFAKEMVNGEWEARTAKELLGRDTVTQTNQYSFPIPDAIAISERLAADELLLLRNFVYNQCKREDYEPAMVNNRYVEGLLNAATNAFCAQAYNEAQINLEEIFTFETQSLNA